MIQNEKKWFHDYFNDDYRIWILDQIPEEMTIQQVEMIVKTMQLSIGNHVLDLCCGLGRHSLALVEKGIEVTAFDLVPDYLQTLQHKTSKYENLHVVCGDARELNFINQFDGVFMMFTSFGYFSEEENIELVDKISQSLKKQGRVLIDIENRDYILKNFIHEKWRHKNQGFLLERHTFFAKTSRQKTRRIWINNQGQVSSYIRDLRLYSGHELINIFEKKGLKLIKAWGDYDQRPFSIQAPRIIFTFEKNNE